MTQTHEVPGELVLKQGGGMEYGNGGWRKTVQITVTNHRIIVADQILFGAKTNSYPVAQIVKVGDFEYWGTAITLMPYHLLRVDFSNGGALLFGLSDHASWSQAIEKARAGAGQASIASPDLHLVTLPTPKTSSTPLPGWQWFVAASMALSLLFFCICPIIVYLVFSFRAK